MYLIMGCASSIPDPNDMYGSAHNNIAPYSKAALQNGAPNNNNNNVATNNERNKRKNMMKGDMSLYTDAKIRREKKLRDSLLNREILAKEMSDKVMEEKERLSLTSSRSRATSPRSALYVNHRAVKSPNPSVKSPVTTRSIGDVGFTSPNASILIREDDVTKENTESQSQACKEGSDRDTDDHCGGVKWKDQNDVASRNGVAPEVTHEQHVSGMKRTVSRISEKSELPEEANSSKM